VGQSGHCKSRKYILLYGRGKIRQLGTGYFVLHREEIVVKGVDIFGDGMS
jgi:hypothetical protein